jgi:putative addiction module killer protein
VLYTIKYYERKNGCQPAYDWLEDQDSTIRSLIRAKIDRVSLGNFSTCESVCKGISEIKIDVGPGYRIYYSMTGLTIILLLCAGTKRTQSKDIKKAQEYLEDYKSRGKTHAKK